MTQPKSCHDCSCLQRNEDGAPFETFAEGRTVNVCERSDGGALIVVELAKTQAVCCEDQTPVNQSDEHLQEVKQ